MLSATPHDQGLELTWEDADGMKQVQTFEKVLVAAGRTPNLKDIGLEHTGLVLDKRGQPSTNRQTTQCGDAPIFLAGDASAFRALLHEAADDWLVRCQPAMSGQSS